MKRFLKCSIIIIILALVVTILYKYNRQSLEEKNIGQVTRQKSNTFIIDKIVAWSSANAKKNEVNQRADWEMDIHQFTDLAVYITIGETTNKEESAIKEIFIQDMKIENSPKLGMPTFYKRKLKDVGSIELDRILQNKLEGNVIDFEIIESTDTLEEGKLQFKKDGTLPLTFGYLNENIRNNYIITDTTIPIAYDASILKRANIPIDSIESTIGFTIKIINELGKVFVADVKIKLPITEELYQGSQIVTLAEKQNFEEIVI